MLELAARSRRARRFVDGAGSFQIGVGLNQTVARRMLDEMPQPVAVSTVEDDYHAVARFGHLRQLGKAQRRKCVRLFFIFHVFLAQAVGDGAPRNRPKTAAEREWKPCIN